MGMFFNSMRKPRGFNHQYIYVDERKEKLAKNLSRKISVASLLKEQRT